MNRKDYFTVEGLRKKNESLRRALLKAADRFRFACYKDETIHLRWAKEATKAAKDNS